jgi:hypothetical protein
MTITVLYMSKLGTGNGVQCRSGSRAGKYHVHKRELWKASIVFILLFTKSKPFRLCVFTRCLIVKQIKYPTALNSFICPKLCLSANATTV